MTTYKTFCLILLVIFSGCKQKPEVLSKTYKETVIAEVGLMFNNYHDDIKKDGLEAEFKYLDSSSNFFWVPPGYESALSYDSVKTILLANAKVISSIEFTWDTLQVFPVTPTIANYSGVVNGTMIDTSNTQSIFKIIESGTLIKRKNGWKLLNGQSRNLPANTN